MSTNIVLTFDNEMTDPSGKHGEFSAETTEGGGEYQEWELSTESPVLTVNYPYQCTFIVGSTHYLIVSATRLSKASSFYASETGTLTWYSKTESATEWTFQATVAGVNLTSDFPNEANADLYENTYTTVIFSQTTTVSTTPLTLTAMALDTDTTKYNITVSETVASTDTVTVSYTKGTVTNAYGVSLESFTDYSVRNIV